MFNDLLVKLAELGYKVFAYADDLAIMSKEKTRLEEAINIVEIWAQENKMTINKKKSGIIKYKRKKNNKSNGSQEILGFPIVRKYKYLGIIIDEKMCWEDHLEYI